MNSTESKHLDEAMGILPTLSLQDTTSFVAQLLSEDPDICERFLRRFGPFGLGVAEENLLCDLRQAEHDHSSYVTGVVDWEERDEFVMQARHIVGTHLCDVLVRGDYESVLALGFVAYAFMTQVDIEGGDDCVYDTLNLLDDVWDVVFNAARERKDDQLLNLLYAKLNAYLLDSDDDGASDPGDFEVGYLCDSQVEHIGDYLVERFSAVTTYAPAMQAIVDEKLESAERLLKAHREMLERTDRPFTSQNPYLGSVIHWMLTRLRCMEAVGVPVGDRIAFAHDYLTEEPVCLHFVGELEHAGEDTEAMRLLDACLDDAKEHGVPAPSWALVRLVGLTERAGDIPRVRDLLEQLVVVGARRADARTWWVKLRGLYGTDEWAELRETLLARVHVDVPRWRYYAEEGLFDRLMNEIESKGTSPLGEFECYLKDRYPERLLALYQVELLGKGGDNPPVGSKRSSYYHYAARVRHLRTIPGGDEVADRIIARVLEIYPRRSALRDELGSA